MTFILINGDLSEELSGGCYPVKTKPPKTLLLDFSIGNIAPDG